MSINTYIDQLNGLLVRSGYKRTDYATANHYYFNGATIGQACAAVVEHRERGLAAIRCPQLATKE